MNDMTHDVPTLAPPRRSPRTERRRLIASLCGAAALFVGSLLLVTHSMADGEPRDASAPEAGLSLGVGPR